MARSLLWQNVPIVLPPAGATTNTSTAGALSGAIDALDRGLARYQEQRDKQNSDLAAQRMLQYSDPQALRAAIASGAITDGLGGVPSAFMGSSADFINTLGRERASNLSHETGRYALDRSQHLDRVADSDRVMSAELAQQLLGITDARQADRVAAEYMAANPGASAALAELAGQRGNLVLGQEGQSLTNQGRRISNATGQFNLNRQRQLAAQEDMLRSADVDTIIDMAQRGNPAAIRELQNRNQGREQSSTYNQGTRAQEILGTVDTLHNAIWNMPVDQAALIVRDPNLDPDVRVALQQRAAQSNYTNPEIFDLNSPINVASTIQEDVGRNYTEQPNILPTSTQDDALAQEALAAALSSNAIPIPEEIRQSMLNNSLTRAQTIEGTMSITGLERDDAAKLVDRLSSSGGNNSAILAAIHNNVVSSSDGSRLGSWASNTAGSILDYYPLVPQGIVDYLFGDKVNVDLGSARRDVSSFTNNPMSLVEQIQQSNAIANQPNAVIETNQRINQLKDRLRTYYSNPTINRRFIEQAESELKREEDRLEQLRELTRALGEPIPR